MKAIRDWFLGLGWTEGWAVLGAIGIGLVVGTLFAEVLRTAVPTVLSKVLPQRKGWAAAFERRRVFRQAILKTWG